jgi:hypothetical protein
LIDTGGARVSVLKGLTPICDVALGRELVEALTTDLEGYLGVARNHLGNHRAGHLDPVELNIAAPVQLQSGSDRQWRETRNLLQEPADRSLDQ